MMARQQSPAKWIVPVLAVGGVLAALELTYQFSRPAAWALAVVVLVAVVVRLVVLGRGGEG